jgi:uncharacterized membrane protein (DUF485 family)
MSERRLFRRVLYLSAMIVSIAFAALVGAANGATSVTSSNGSGAHWGFLIAIAVAIIAFIVCGLFIVVRSRREYLAMEARKASRPPDEEG